MSFPEGVTATVTNQFRSGDLIGLVSGKAVGLADPTVNASIDGASAAILGIATRNHGSLATAQANGAGTLNVAVADDNLVFILPIYDATASNTYPSNNAIGSYWRFGFQSSICCALYSTKQATVTAGVQLQLVGYIQGTSASEPYPYAYFTVIRSERVFV